MILRAGLAKFDECRAKCPGAGGDIDAANLRFLLGRGGAITGEDRPTLEQAARTLESLAVLVKVDAAPEALGLRSVFRLEAAAEMESTLHDAGQALAHAIHVTRDSGTFSTSIALKGTEQRVKDTLLLVTPAGTPRDLASLQVAPGPEELRHRQKVIARYVADHGYFVQQAEPGSAVFVVAPEREGYRHIARMDEGLETEQLAAATTFCAALNAAMVAKLSPQDVDDLIVYYGRMDAFDAKFDAAKFEAAANGADPLPDRALASGRGLLR